MGRYINWYIVELERLLTGHLKSTKLAETLGEVEAHLADSATDLQVSCQHGEDSEKLAVDRFGSPRDLAVDMVITQHQKPYLKAAIWPVTATVIMMSFPFVYEYQRGDMSGPLSFFAILLCASIAWVSWKNKRTSIRAMAGISLVCVLMMALVSMIAFPFVANQRANQTRKGIKNQVTELQMNKAWLNQGMTAFQAAAPDQLPSEFRKEKTFVVGIRSPYYSLPPVYDMDPDRSSYRVQYPLVRRPLGFETSAYLQAEDPSWDHAKKWWSKEAPKAITAINTDLNDLDYSYRHYGEGYVATLTQGFKARLRSKVLMTWFLGLLLTGLINLVFARASRMTIVRSLDRRQFV